MVTNNVGCSSYRERYNPYVSYVNFSQAEQIKKGPKVVSKAKKQEKALAATGITIAALIAAIVLLRKGKVKEAAKTIEQPAKTAGNVTGKTTGIFQKIKDFFARINPFNKKASRSSVVKPQVAPADSRHFKRNANKLLKDTEKQRYLAKQAELEEAFRNYTPPATSSVQSNVSPVAQAANKKKVTPVAKKTNVKVKTLSKKQKAAKEILDGVYAGPNAKLEACKKAGLDIKIEKQFTKNNFEKMAEIDDKLKMIIKGNNKPTASVAKQVAQNTVPLTKRDTIIGDGVFDPYDTCGS